ncbi:hydroxyacylglutathione hydrolase [Sphingomonas sp. BIUV-7]|uniref:Hydroxyacylglutathione hydrolase n=1 Tax=Sphingomonas natans TaxID=3063330 RepID=A0ABT8Y4S3_9SPHN|nr:hydroxyacylglutathione hydrolase [Sphingomonas sp. BIUV-7]MDO6413319.1 hydroxyacylglutathione hydrolase [Sphingomonas sp. BIUV-7]
MALTIHQFRCLADNYGFLVRDEATGKVAAIDTPDADAYAAELDRRGWQLDLIVNTHWHPDHAGGNLALKARTGAEIAAPAEVTRIAPIDREIRHGDTIALGETRFAVIDTGGHTNGHVSLYDAADGVVFVGDTLFTLGCGRMFEGTPPQFWESLSRLAALPDATRVYCAHEYTAANLRFAQSVDTGAALAARALGLERRIAAGEPTVPTSIGEEKATNPFLRAPDLAIAADAGDPAQAFGIVRAAKDAFKG